MPDIAEGETVEVQGSGKTPYKMQNIGGVYSCTCPAWLYAGGGIETRTCKHLKAYRGEDVELARVGASGGGASSSSKGGGGGKAAAASKGKAPPLLLAHKWENDIDLVGWWMSEKLDGVRAYWDGERFISRLGNAFVAPEWFTAGLPTTPLDGELWGGRKQFQRTVSIVRRTDKTDHWRSVRYLVFDAPEEKKPFEQRMSFIDDFMAQERPPYADAHSHERCSGHAHLRQELLRVEKRGGEGLMLRKPSSHYEHGRSSTLLKVKTFHDADAKVIDHLAGSGKHKNRLGALLVEMPDGTRFNVGTGFTDKEREDPPPVGSIIIYRYQELTDGGVPRFPSYVGVRIDADQPSTPHKPKKK